MTSSALPSTDAKTIQPIIIELKPLPPARCLQTVRSGTGSCQLDVRALALMCVNGRYRRSATAWNRPTQRPEFQPRMPESVQDIMVRLLLLICQFLGTLRARPSIPQTDNRPRRGAPAGSCPGAALDQPCPKLILFGGG